MRSFRAALVDSVVVIGALVAGAGACWGVPKGDAGRGSSATVAAAAVAAEVAFVVIAGPCVSFVT